MTTHKELKRFGIKRICEICYLKHQKEGAALAGQMCPRCGNFFDEFGHHNKLLAHKWIYQTFQQAGFPIPDTHIETLYTLARLKVSHNEATFLEVIEFALNELRAGGRLPGK
jgi:protein-arginine kinase activator protein McsA